MRPQMFMSRARSSRKRQFPTINGEWGQVPDNNASSPPYSIHGVFGTCAAIDLLLWLAVARWPTFIVSRDYWDAIVLDACSLAAARGWRRSPRSRAAGSPRFRFPLFPHPRRPSATIDWRIGVKHAGSNRHEPTGSFIAFKGDRIKDPTGVPNWSRRARENLPWRLRFNGIIWPKLSARVSNSFVYDRSWRDLQTTGGSTKSEWVNECVKIKGPLWSYPREQFLCVLGVYSISAGVFHPVYSSLNLTVDIFINYIRWCSYEYPELCKCS